MNKFENLDPDLVDAFERMKVRNIFGNLDFSNLTLEQIPLIRKSFANFSTSQKVKPNEKVTWIEQWVPSADSTSEIRIKIYRPVNQESILPCFFHIHGGGMIMGSIDGEESYMALLAGKLDCVVVSVDYRLAPEHPYPTPVEDCYTSLMWIVKHADSLRIDPSRIIIGGESAGGGLAAATSLLARDRGGPFISFQYLIYPMLDDRNITPSSKQFVGNWSGWSREMNLLGWRSLLGELAGTENVSPYAAPARAKDLSRLPAVYIEVGTLDVFRDEVIEYAQRLMQANVPVELHVIPGVFHGWDIAAPKADVSRRVATYRKDALKRALYPK